MKHWGRWNDEQTFRHRMDKSVQEGLQTGNETPLGHWASWWYHSQAGKRWTTSREKQRPRFDRELGRASWMPHPAGLVTGLSDWEWFTGIDIIPNGDTQRFVRNVGIRHSVMPGVVSFCFGNKKDTRHSHKRKRQVPVRVPYSVFVLRSFLLLFLFTFCLFIQQSFFEGGLHSWLMVLCYM